MVVNRWYGREDGREGGKKGRCLQTFEWPRLPHAFHGSGCTLAAATAGFLARGLEPLAAVAAAQQYTWDALKHAYVVGRGQLLPGRLHRACLALPDAGA